MNKARLTMACREQAETSAQPVRVASREPVGTGEKSRPFSINYLENIAGKRDEPMKKCKKPARGQRISEGQRVKSLRPEDNGSPGTVLKASPKKGGWAYSVMFDGWYRVAERPEGELEGIS